MSIPSGHQPVRYRTDPESVSTFWTWFAFLLALIGLGGSFFLTLGMNLIACPLCFYQRTLILALVGVLIMGLVAGPRRSGFLSLITVPLTVAGIGVAGWQVYLEYKGDLECPDGVICQAYKEFKGHDDWYARMHGVVTAPKESLGIFVLIFLIQAVDVLRSRDRDGFGMGALLAGMIVGGLLAAGIVVSLRDHRDIPKAPQPLEGCRPPQKGA